MIASDGQRTSIRSVQTRADHRAFCDLPYALYRKDPLWVPPLRSEERRRWDASHNASLRARPHCRFLACRGRVPVGRAVAILDEGFAERWAPGAGLFGFLECRNDEGTARDLLDRVESWLRDRGCTRVIGPVNLSTNEEVGLLVDGFESPPMVLSPYNPPCYEELVRAAGYAPERDYLSYHWDVSRSPSRTIERVVRMVAAREGRHGLIVRQFDARRWDRDVGVVRELYNRSFAGVWGFVPMTEEEFRQQAERFRPFHRAELAVIAEVEEVPVGFGLILPDVNEVLRRVGGRVWPLGWLKAGVGVRRLRTGRFVLLGVLPEHAGRGIGASIAWELERAVRALGYRHCEVSLVQEQNRRVRRVIEEFGCVPIKTYRLFGKSLT